MSERIQLKEPGSELLMVVSSVKPEIVERNEYYLFGNGPKELLVPQSSVKGRLERLGVTSAEHLIGKTVRFARSMKMSRANAPYWDIDVVSMTGVMPSGAEQAPVPSAGGEGNAGKSASAPPVEPPAAKTKLTDLYMKASEFVIDKIVPLYMEANITPTDDAVAAMVATLFIAATKER